MRERKRLVEDYEELKRNMASDYLSDVRDACIRMASISERIEINRDILDNLMGVDYSNPKVSSGHARDRIADGISDMQELVNEMSESAAEYASVQREALDVFSAIPKPAREAMELYWLSGMTWSDVGARLGYNGDWLRHLSTRALLIVYDRMPHRYKIPAHPAI